MAGPQSVGGDTRVVVGELLRALESTRSRLAVTIASQSKVTPMELWRLYMETETLMRRHLKGLRSQMRSGPEECSCWSEALERLRQPLMSTGSWPKSSQTRQLCMRLREVLEILPESRRNA